MGRKTSDNRGYLALGGIAAVGVAFVGGAVGFGPPPPPPLATTRNDFFNAGTAPGTLNDALVSAVVCSFCHGAFAEDQAPYDRWVASMMAQSARDPVFYAALSIAEQDSAFIGDTCIRCHTPGGWLNGHANETNGSQLEGDDFQGVNCSSCHRMVDPIYTEGSSPAVDLSILANIVPPVVDPHNGSYVVDPEDRRRGPRDLQSDWLIINPPDPPDYPGGWPGFHRYERSPYHDSSRMCATCHDVSVPTFTRNTGDGSYDLNAFNQEGPSKYHQFPEQRTYSEWSQSLFAAGQVNIGEYPPGSGNPRFGGTKGPLVSSCQDCHMSGIAGQGCGLEPPVRPKLHQHNFQGSNTWVLAAIKGLYYDSESGLSDESVTGALDRVRENLARASDLEVTKLDRDTLNARVINMAGHKLPTGYAEGRRMWINVQFFNAQMQLIAERGAYNPSTAVLDSTGTTVYEAKFGLDAEIAAASGRPEGPAFRLALVNTILKDNRIPPMGFNNAQFEQFQSGSVPAGQYADGAYWDDTEYTIPFNARSARVTVYYQTSSSEYMEFLRDEDRTPRLPNLPEIPPEFGFPPITTSGQLAYHLWEFYGKSAPVVMDQQSIALGCPCDWNNSGALSSQDLFDFLASWFNGQGDFNQSGSSSAQDIFDFLACFFSPCS